MTAPIIFHCHFSYTENWELVNSIVETKFGKSHICLHYQREYIYNILSGIFSQFSKWQWNRSALLLYAMIISVQRLTQVIKSYTADFLKIQRHNSYLLISLFSYSLILKNGDKNVTILLKGKQIQLL